MALGIRIGAVQQPKQLIILPKLRVSLEEPRLARLGDYLDTSGISASPPLPQAYVRDSHGTGYSNHRGPTTTSPPVHCNLSYRLYLSNLPVPELIVTCLHVSLWNIDLL